MDWNSLTVAHYQALYPVIQDKELNELEKEAKIVSILYELTEAEVDSMSWESFKKLRNESNFLFTDIPGKPVKYIFGKHKKYKLIYQVEKSAFARYAEIKTFRGETEADFIHNMHKLTASMIKPMRNVCGLWIEEKYDATKHEAYSEDLRYCKFIDVYHACVFFYQLFFALTINMRDYLVRGMVEAGIPIAEAIQHHQNLCNDLAGFITLNKLPNLKESQLKRFGILTPGTL